MRVWKLLLVAFIAALSAPALHGQVTTTIVNDSFTDGGRDNGADALDTNWWASSSTSGIEVSPGSLGMVTGSTGRGIHAIFPTQTLNVGDSLKATYTFTTPATVGTAAASAFRVGMFDTLARDGLNADITASTASPSPLYGYYNATPSPTTGLPGYMMDMDVNTGATSDLAFRQHETAVNAAAQTPTGRLLGTTTGFTQVMNTGPDAGYTFTPNTQYTGSLMLTRIDDTQFQITGTLGDTTTYSVTDAFDSPSFGMLAFWANSNIFGSANTPGAADNGIDFSNVKIEYTTSVPEPTSMSVLALGLGWVIRRRR
jgi:hypothetical protein